MLFLSLLALHDRFLVSSLQWLHNWMQTCQKSLRCVVQILRNKDTIHKDLAVGAQTFQTFTDIKRKIAENTIPLCYK